MAAARGQSPLGQDNDDARFNLDTAGPGSFRRSVVDERDPRGSPAVQQGPARGGSGARLRIDRRGGGLGHGSEVRKKMGRQAPDRPEAKPHEDEHPQPRMPPVGCFPVRVKRDDRSKRPPANPSFLSARDHQHPQVVDEGALPSGQILRRRDRWAAGPK